MAMNSQILSKEQVLIVGCGDIGARFAALLSRDTYEVTGLRRNAPPNTSPNAPFLQYQTCDVTDPTQLDQRLKAHNFAVILVTMTPSERSDAGYQRAYAQTCTNLIATLKKNNAKPRLILFVSSTGVYGQNDGSWVDENSPTQPDSFSGKRLLEAEHIIQNSEFTSTIVRFSGIYGPGRHRLIDQVRQRRASLSQHITNRIHAHDCAASLAYLVELQRQGVSLEPVYIATDNAPVPMVEVVMWLAQQLKIEGDLGDLSTNDGANKCCSNQRLLATGFGLRYPDYRVGYAAILDALP
jgi:nucleoside-diphosphate-sugar epimerase